MKEIALVFPTQLFEKHPALNKTRPVFLAEEFLFFRLQPFHKQKLVLLRAAMKGYEEYLKNKGFDVHYLESSKLKKRGDLFHILSKLKIQQIHFAELPDDWLNQDLKKAHRKYGWELKSYPSPMFLCTEDEIEGFFKGKKTFSMASFYAYQRKKLNILMKNGAPIGGKFSFDQDNRKKLPKDVVIPNFTVPKQLTSIKKAIAYVEEEFQDAIGEASPFLFATTFAGAHQALESFISERLELFGDYEDAIIEGESFLFHSVLSPLLNIGLLTPCEVVEAALVAHKKHKIPLNSLEGFIRQVIGWREYMRACYVLKGRQQRSSNFFKHKKSLPKSFWKATTGIVPIDKTIQKILKTGYCHHIERLMVLGNFMLLMEIDPNDVYSWFMEHFVDAYDWVMVPNIYGMSQYADKGITTTKPYISGANYILKMSNYSKGEWAEIWDGLFWRFIAKHKSLFQTNPRTKVLLSLLDKGKSTIQPKIAHAEKWLKKIL